MVSLSAPETLRAMTRYPWPGIELEKKQRDLVALEQPEVVAAATAERKKQADIVLAEGWYER